MKKAVICCLVVFGVIILALPAYSTDYVKASKEIVSTNDKDQSRVLIGQVTDKDENPLAGAVVYLKNTKTIVVKTYITDADGQYRFRSLSPNVDYEIYAEYQVQRSKTRTLSSFDSRSQVTMNLKIEHKK